MGRGLWLSAANCTSVPLISRQPAFTLVDQVECFGLFKAETVFVSMALASSAVPDCWVGAAVAKMSAPAINAMAVATCPRCTARATMSSANLRARSTSPGGHSTNAE